MPFRSEAQRRFLWARHPGLARRWTDEYGSAIKPSREKVADALVKHRTKKKHRG